jgi:hypothetical protein
MMKSSAASKLSVIDALTTGLTTVARRPWLIIVPVVIDLVLWLAPRLSINNLAMKFFTVWEALVRAAYTPAQLASMEDMIDAMREVLTRFGADANLVDAITGNWLGPSSALLAVQSTRQTFVSDTLLAPLGLSLDLPRIASFPWQAAPIEINSLWTTALIFLGFWLTGQLLVAVYFMHCSRPLRVAFAGRAQRPPRVAGDKAPTASAPAGAIDPPNETTGEPLATEGDVVPIAAGEVPVRTTPGAGAERWNGARGLLGLAVRLTAFSLLLSLVVMLMRLPLGAAVLMTVFSGGAGAGILFALVGGITLWALLWFLTSVYFSSEGIVFEGQAVWRSVLQSLLMIRGQVLSTFGLVLTVNVVLLGFRAVWGLIGQSPVGGAVAILGNGFLTTGMLLAIFVYFGEMRRRWQAREAQAFGSLTRRNQPKDR